jgi:HEAT repeat protein
LLPSFSLTKVNSAVLLFFIATAISIISTTYVNALFLTSYPGTWLPYFFIGQGLVEFFAAYFIAPVLIKNPLKISLYLQTVIAICMLVFFFLLNFNLFWLPLVFSLFLLTIRSLALIITWSSIHSAFDLIEFKGISSLLSLIGTISSIVSSFILVALIKKFGTHSLPIALFILVVITCLFIYKLKPLLVINKKLKRSGSPLKYPIYKKLLISTCLMFFAYTLIDYCLKLKLREQYSAAEIGIFIGLFIGSTSVITLFVNLFCIKPLINYFGPTSLLMTVPIYWVLTSIAVIFFPSLWVVAMMAAGRYIFQTSAYDLGRELVLNILPGQIKLLGQFLLKSMAPSLMTCVGAIVLFILQKYFNIPAFSVLIMILSGLSFFYMWKMPADYLNTLKEEIQLKRFNLNEELVHADIHTANHLIVEALEENNPDVIRFGFGLLLHQPSSQLSTEIFRHLRSPFADIRISAIKALSHAPTTASIEMLLQCFAGEEDPEVKWTLFDVLANLHVVEALSLARKHLNDSAAEVCAGAIRVMLVEGNIDDILLAVDKLKKLLQNAEPAMRKSAARVIGCLRVGDLSAELLALIADADATVSANAIEAASSMINGALATAIVQRVTQLGVYHSAEKALSQLGKDAIPILMESIQAINTQELSGVNELVRLLASLSAVEAEASLAILGAEKNVFICNAAAKESAYRARHVVPSDEFREQAYALAFAEANKINLLRHAQKNHPDIVANEFNSRKLMAKKRFLYWVAVYTNAAEIINLMPTILFGERMEQAKAIELMTTTIRNPLLSELTIDIIIRRFAQVKNKKVIDEKIYLDRWLMTVIDFVQQSYAGGDMNDNMQKVFVLRAVELFKQLPGETLLVIANEAEKQDMQADQIIFSEGDAPTGLYIVVSGQVDIVKNGKVIAELKENSFFGELALIDNSTRTATAVAKTEGVLLFLEKEIFDRIADDLPEVLRAVVQVVMRYLRVYLH